MMTSKYIQFEAADGQRKTIRLPGLNANQVKAVNRHIRALNAARIANLSVEEETARWLSGVSGWLRDKLIEVGLIESREVKPTEILSVFLRDYMANREALVKSGKLESSTTSIDYLTRDCLIEFFGPDKPLQEISEGDALDFYDWLLAEGGRPTKRCGSETVIRERKSLKPSTVHKRCSIASKFFLHARRKRIIDKNPFDAVNKGNMAATDNKFLSAKDANKVLAELPDSQWKLLFALARWGGLRTGSEPRQLKWEHVDWIGQRILIHAPKNKRYEGKDKRLIPLYAELLPLLRACRAEAAKDEQYVLPMLIGRSDASLRDTMFRAIASAGLKVWPNLWRSLRSTRQTELEDRGTPTHVVCYWMNNSPKVAQKHYLKVHEDHYAKAVAQVA
jgi:integrase